jgi:signal transduction histidine kinase
MSKNDELDSLAAQEEMFSNLCSNLSLGLHAAAQPLTILRASLDRSLTGKMSKGELRELAARSAEEIERICLLFSLLRELVSAEKAKPKLSAISFEPVLTRAIDGANHLFEQNGILLRSVMPEIGQLVLINEAKLLQALSSVLFVAHDLSSPKDTVEVFASSHPPDTVRLVVRNWAARSDSLSAVNRLNLVLAEANIRGQQGNFFWSLNPFKAQIELRMGSIVT